VFPADERLADKRRPSWIDSSHRVWVTFFAALLILPILFGALIAGYSAFSEVDGSEALLPPAFWILIAAGGALGGYIGVKVGVVRGSALDYRL